MKEIPVITGEKKYTYFLTAGTFDKIGLVLKRFIGQRRVLVVSQPPVDDLYMDVTVKNLRDTGIEVEYLLMPSGETGKNLNTIEELTNKALELGIDRSCVILALGGGVVGDTAGFLASIYMRGIDYIQVPTTLLAMVDSSIGGKVAVNVSGGKNIIGAFHQPLAVFADASLLNTLSDKEFGAALAEVIKYGAGFDREFFEWLELNTLRVLKRDPIDLMYIIEKCVKLKVDIVENDEKDRGERMPLNLGHTMAHAIENAGNYEKHSHGEAVGTGLVFAFLIARRLGRVTDDEVYRVKKLITRVDLPVKPEGFSYRDFMKIVRRDKKWKKGTNIFILPDGVGKCDIVSGVEEKLIKQAFDDLMKGM